MESPGDAGVGTVVISVAVGWGGAVVAMGAAGWPPVVQADIAMKSAVSRMFCVLFMCGIVS